VIDAYALLKPLHVGAVALSGAGFLLRGLGMLVNAGWLQARPVRVLPHIVDTVLLASALGLAWTLRISPLAHPWLAAKIGGLLVYIALGMLALRPGRPKALRVAAWAGACLAFYYIVSVALTKSPLGPWAL
jgi:uncharacterized membrane protein SirB2